MISPETDCLAYALRTGRGVFLLECPFYILFSQAPSEGEYPTPSSTRENPRPPARGRGRSNEEEITEEHPVPFGGELDEPPRIVLAVRKTKAVFPSMITLGRTSTNDLHVADVQVSRFHAFFLVHDDRVELGDAGSANGTWVGGTKLVPKGPSVIVVPGETIRFAHLAFHFLAPGDAWDRIRATAPSMR